MSNNPRKFSYMAIVIAAVSATIAFFTCTRQKATYRMSEGVVWTTDYHITYESEAVLDDSITAALSRVDNSLSQFNEHSLVSRINRSETDSVDNMFSLIYNLSKQVNHRTAGGFDPTVSPLVFLWGFGTQDRVAPTRAKIDSILEFVGIGKTQLRDGRIIKKDKRTAFDFSAIAKGFGCDEVGRMFLRNGVKNFMIEIGGEIVTSGVNSRGEKWHISIDKPIEDNDSAIHNSALVLEVGNSGIATSGNYRNYHLVDNKKVSHTINPATGYPEVSRLLSATIVAKDCATADALATGCMVIGLERSRVMLDHDASVGVMLIYARDNGSYGFWSNDTFRKLKSSKMPH